MWKNFLAILHGILFYKLSSGEKLRKTPHFLDIIFKEGSPLGWLVNFQAKTENTIKYNTYNNFGAIIEKFSAGFVEGLAERGISRLLSSGPLG